MSFPASIIERRVLKPNGSAILSGPTETVFYKFCRYLWLQDWSYPEDHLRTVYEIEKMFEAKKFANSLRKKLPGFPIPDLFRITKYTKG